MQHATSLHSLYPYTGGAFAGSACLKDGQGISSQPYVVGIRLRNKLWERKPIRVDHQARFYSLFTPVCGIAVCFF